MSEAGVTKLGSMSVAYPRASGFGVPVPSLSMPSALSPFFCPPALTTTS